MAAARCTCGAPAPLAGTACHYCGGEAAAAVKPLDTPVEPATGSAAFVESRRREAHEREVRQRDARAREHEQEGRQAREREARQREAEREAREREVRQREARERQARGREARDREARDREARDREARDREARQREARQREAEREARDREARRVEQAAVGPVDVGQPHRDEDQEADDLWARELREEEQDGDAPAGRPPAREARRFRGLAVPLVAAAVVAGIGYPLTALAVSRVRLPETPGQEESSAEGGGSGSSTRSQRVRLTGAVNYDGPGRPIECTGGTPILMTFGAGEDQVAIRLGLPSVVEPGSYEVKGQDVFVAVTRLAGKAQTWSTRNQPDASGELQVRPDRSVSARFNGLKPAAGAGEDTVQGSLEMRCG